MTIAEACEMKKPFCLKQRQGTVQPDRNNDYHYQIPQKELGATLLSEEKRTFLLKE